MHKILYSINPSIKLLLISIPVIWITIFINPIISLILLMFSIVSILLFSRVKFGEIINYLSMFLFIGLGFVLFFLITKGISGSGHELKFWIFNWNLEDIVTSISLGLRIPVFAAYSMLFVKTTDPSEFARSLIFQMHIPYEVCYAFLSAYSFAPNFKNEINKLKMAHYVRGVKKETGINGILKEFKMYIIPLLISAIRKGEKVSLAMDSKGFRAFKERTYYKEVKVHYIDFISIIIMVLICILSYGISIKIF